MGRTKGARNKSYLSRFKTYEGTKPKDRHIRMTYDMLMNPNILKLPGNALKLYCYMKLWACGQPELRFSHSLAKKLMTGPTFTKAKKDLIQFGLIDQPNYFSARDKREPCEFVFSDRWSERR